MTQEGDLLWTPSTARAEASNMADFIRTLRTRHGLALDDYDALWRWSVDNVESFWSTLWEYFDISSETPYQRVMSGTDMMSTRWFEGARINYAEHLLRHEAHAAPGEVVFSHSSEIRPLAELSWHELGALVRSAATHLRALGVQPGDRVVSYMPNVPETAVAMMATVAIGAIWSAAAPEFGVTTTVERFSQIQPKLIFAADGYSFGGKTFDRRQEVSAIVERLPSVEAIVWLPYLGLAMPNSSRASVSTVTWDQLIATPGPSRADFRFERVPHDHPLWVLYSSGTTGLPKAITHSHIGMILDQMKQMLLHFDMKPGKRMFFYSTTGWMMWNAGLSALLGGASTVLYDGSPTWPAIDTLWDIVETAGVTTFGASPTLVQMMEKAGVRPCESRDLSKLDAIILGGAPSTAATFQWFYDQVKTDLWVINTSGGTDLCGGLVGPVPLLPVHAAEFQGRMLGLAVEAWNDLGESVIDEVGELVVTKPFPSMPLYFWGDTDNRRYYESYFDTFPGVWRHGDYIKINQRGGCYIYGRADATLNRYGVRIGTSEIYRVVNDIERVQDCIIVCCETAGGGFFMPLFVQLRGGDTLDEELITEINRRLREENSPRHVPDMIVQAPVIPYTMTGKKMEVPLRKILMGAAADKVSRPDAMSDPNALSWYVDFGQRPEIKAKL